MAKATLDIYVESIKMEGDASKCSVCDEKIFGPMIKYFMFLGDNLNPKEIGLQVHAEHFFENNKTYGERI